MSEAENLQQLRERYTSVLREAGERLVAEPPSGLDPTVRDAVKRIAQLAADADEAARSPVRIGVVGEFSAGKTLLLGSLIGYADALPISELPTTGNVTALNFIPVDEEKTTEVPTSSPCLASLPVSP